MKHFYFLGGLLFFVLTLSSQNITSEEILVNRGELFFKFKIPTHLSLSDINELVSIDNIKDGYVYAYANKKEFNVFSELKIDSEPVKEYYSNTKAIVMADDITEMINWDQYPTWNLYEEMMISYAFDHPDICVLDTIGYSVEGRALLCLIISDNIESIEAEPKFFWTNTMHGDELVGYVLSLRLADYLLSNYGNDDFVDSLVNNIRIYINPLANPDGTFYNSPNGSTVTDSRRNNANDIDLNRNFPRIDNIPTSIEVEIQAMIDYSEIHNFTMSVNTHSGAEVINYPWDFWTSEENPPADDNWWQYISNIYATQTIANSPSGYLQGVSENGYTEGADWYSITGSRQDYMNYYKNCREMTLELSNQKKLESEELPAHWEYNYQSMLDYTAQVLYGIRGIVTDSITGYPIEAKIEVIDHDKDNSHVFSHLPHGDYYRPIEEGIFTLKFTANGYKSKEFVIETENNQAYYQNVQLVPLSELPPYPDFEASQTNINCNPLVSFTNLSEASDETVYTWDFGDGTSSNQTNPQHAYTSNGTYTVILHASNNNGQNEIIKTNYLNVNINDFDATVNGSFCTETGNAVFADEDSLNFNFYLFENDITPSYSGSYFNVDTWDETTHCFAEQIFEGLTYNIGLFDNSDGGDYNSDDTNHFLLFDCQTPVILNSVKVYAESDGERVINFYNNSGFIIESASIYIQEGEQIIELNFNIPSENGLRLECEGPSNLFVGESSWIDSFDYPFEVENVISITGNDYPYISTFRYPYFYDWHISEPDCYSERVELFVSDTLNSPVADFNFTNIGLQYQFTNTSADANIYLWNFGDNTESNEENPTHTYSEPGNYQVTLTATNTCGSNTYSQNINVESSVFGLAENYFKVFPNPAQNTINIKTNVNKYDIQVFNLQGICILKRNDCSKNTSFNINHYESGLYIICIFSDEKTERFQIIKQ